MPPAASGRMAAAVIGDVRTGGRHPGANGRPRPDRLRVHGRYHLRPVQVGLDQHRATSRSTRTRRTRRRWRRTSPPPLRRPTDLASRSRSPSPAATRPPSSPGALTASRRPAGRPGGADLLDQRRDERTAAKISGGSATLTVTVPSPGPHDVWVYEIDCRRQRLGHDQRRAVRAELDILRARATRRSPSRPVAASRRTSLPRCRQARATATR